VVCGVPGVEQCDLLCRGQRLYLFQIEWVRHLIDPLKYDIFMQHFFDFQPGKYDPWHLMNCSDSTNSRSCSHRF
jgi:hypothetical protein